MKKNYWSLFMCLAVFASAFTLTSCDKDEIGSSSDLIGTWELVRNHGYWIEDGEKERWDDGVDEIDVDRMTFKKDGTLIWTEDDDPGYEEDEYRYKFKDNKLYIYEEGDEDDAEIVKVVKLTSSELVFEIHEKENRYEYYDKYYYKKVK